MIAQQRQIKNRRRDENYSLVTIIQSRWHKTCLSRIETSFNLLVDAKSSADFMNYSLH